MKTIPIFLLAPTLAAVELITPTATELLVGSEFFPAVNVTNGSGLSAPPTFKNYKSITHAAASGSTAWTTDAPGGGSADYFRFGPEPVFLFTFDQDHQFSDLVCWGYHFGNANGNEGQAFKVEFSTDQGATFGPPVEVEAPAISRSASTAISLGGSFPANAIRFTITDNWFEEVGGGDRVGLGEVRFLGETPVNPAPIIHVNTLLDFGVNPGVRSRVLLIENSGVVDDLIVSFDLEAGTSFSISEENLIVPAGSSALLTVQFHSEDDGCFRDTIRFTTNDPARPELEVTCLAGLNCAFPAPGKPGFSAAEGVFTDSFLLALEGDEGATILYSLDGSIPGEESGFLYREPIVIDSSVQVRAASYFPGQAPAIRTRSFVKLASDVAAYSSPLPIMVVENFNRGIIPNKGWSTATQTGGGLRQVARQPAFLGVYDRPQAEETATFSNEASQTSRIGIRVRGAFSSTWNPKPFSVETWQTDLDEDRDLKIPGMSSESDWILYYPDPNYDRTMIYNAFIWELSRQTGRWAPRFRFVDLFVNENGGDLTLADRRGVYVFLEKPKRDSKRLEFEKLSEDGASGGWINSINRMDPEPVDGFPAENGARSPRFFHTAGPDRIHATPPNVSGAGDDIPRQYNAFLNFESPNGYRINAAQRTVVENWYRDFEDVFYDDDIWRDPEIGYRQHLDTRDFIDYFQMLTLAKQGDGLLLSMFPWVSSEDRKLRMGPMWDFNNGAYAGSTSGTLYFRPDRLWYGRLFEDPDFQREYEDRWFELREGPLSNENMARIIEAQADEITTGLAEQQNGLSASSWSSRLETMKTFLQTRAEWIDSNFLAPPSFSSKGGVVAEGFRLTITNTTGQNGAIFYALDGRDPIDSPVAYQGPIQLPESTEVSARVRTTDGNWSALKKATFVVGVPARAANLIVSEINYHPAGDHPGTEFIELLNISDETIDLTKVAFTAGLSFVFPTGVMLAPKKRIVMVENSPAFIFKYGETATIAGEFANLTRLSNSGEQITLTGADGSVIFDLEYNDKNPWPEFADGRGCTLTLIQPETRPDLSLASSWRCSAALAGSPGAGDALRFAGTEDGLIDFVLGGGIPRILETGSGSFFEYEIMIGAEDFVVTPQSSPDLVSWQPLEAPTQPSKIESGTATYRAAITVDKERSFFRLLITPRP